MVESLTHPTDPRKNKNAKDTTCFTIWNLKTNMIINMFGGFQLSPTS